MDTRSLSLISWLILERQFSDKITTRSKRVTRLYFRALLKRINKRKLLQKMMRKMRFKKTRLRFRRMSLKRTLSLGSKR